MHHLVRTRSQHFVSSPRKGATPLKHKLGRHPSKRRRITLAELGNDSVAAESTIETDDEIALGPSKRERSILSAETGEQTANQPSRLKSKRREKGGRSMLHVLDRETKDVFGSADESSPRKRKRGETDAVPAPGSTSGSGSWVEVTEDEGEPEYIAESEYLAVHFSC